MLTPIIARRFSLLMALLALLAGAWVEVDAAPLTRPSRPADTTSAFRSDLNLASTERLSAAFAMVAADLDADGDLDVLGLDGSLTLLVWENDGSGALTLKEPSETPKVVPDGDEASLDSPVIAEISDQSESASVRLERRTEPIVPTPSRGVCADRPVPLHTLTRSSSAPRAPPVSIPSL